MIELINNMSKLHRGIIAEKDKRIAKLEAELKQLKSNWEDLVGSAYRDNELVKHLQAERDALIEKHNELIMAVATKHKNETRHETALRYIQEAEQLYECGQIEGGE